MPPQGLHVGCHALAFKFWAAANVANVQGSVSQELLDATSHIEGPKICIAVAKMCNVIWFDWFAVFGDIGVEVVSLLNVRKLRQNSMHVCRNSCRASKKQARAV